MKNHPSPRFIALALAGTLAFACGGSNEQPNAAFGGASGMSAGGTGATAGGGGTSGGAAAGGSGGIIMPPVDPGADTDGDLISDAQENASMAVDTDGDGDPDFTDTDSDNDGIFDRDEAGDTDLTTPPVDTDGDLAPDFRDADSDDDGLGDFDEVTAGTDPKNPDSDGDGVTDLVEVVSCGGDPACAGDPTDPSSSPKTRGNFVFLEPYQKPPTPERDTLDFATEIQKADVYLLVDTTGSMGEAIASLKLGLSTPMTGLIDRVRDTIPDVWIGVGDYRDYPAGPFLMNYGDPGDYAYRHSLDVQPSSATAQSTVDALSLGNGADGPESLVPALFSIATASGLAGLAGPAGVIPPQTGCPMMHRGYPCFRGDAVAIAVIMTDAPSHNGPPVSPNNYNDGFIGGPTPTYQQLVNAMSTHPLKMIGIAVGPNAQAKGTLDDLARISGAVDAMGAPLTSTWTPGAEISDAVVTQIQSLANSTPIDVSVRFIDDPSDSVDTEAAFVDHLEANETGDPTRGCDPRMATGTPYPDTFPAVSPGDRVCFDVIVKQNDTVAPTAVPQLFKATVEVVGDGISVLDSRDVFFLVPPDVEIPPVTPPR